MTQWQQWVSTALLALLVVVPVGFLVWVGFFTDSLSIRHVAVVGANESNQEQARAIAKKVLEGSVFGGHILFMDTISIEHAIVTEMAEIRVAHASRVLPNTIKVVLQEKTPVILLLSGGEYYFVDENAVAYARASLENLPGLILPTVKNLNPDSEVTLGVPIVEENFLEFIRQVGEESPEITGAEVVEVQIPSLAAREVHFLLSNNWQVRFDLTRPADEQLSNLDRVIGEHLQEEELKQLEYIDLRIAGRIYYK